MGQTTDEIRRKRQELANRKGTEIRNLSKKEKRKTSQKVIRKKRKEKFIRGIFLALGITIGAGGHALLTAGNNKEQETKETVTTENTAREEFINGLSVTNTPEVAQNQEKEDIYQTIVNEYNKQYPDDQISINDLGILSSSPTGQIYESEGQYIQDYDLDREVYPDAKLVEDDYIDEYLIIDKSNNDIILAMAYIRGNEMNNSQAEYIDVEKYIVNSDSGQKIYMGKQITLGETQEEKEELFENLENKYQEVVKAQEEAKVNKRLEDLGIDDR